MTYDSDISEGDENSQQMLSTTNFVFLMRNIERLMFEFGLYLNRNVEQMNA